mmetsp:Transcript_155121/g.476507  ORF Transcript_155121/g.476507 Transcript_155121/m.476507 type:complete len:96 (-) Transcript_155121:76-363(-)
MPSIHRAMEVRYAVTKGAGLWQAAAGCEVVVKVRCKSGAFSSKRAEQVWRNNSEKLLNLPACQHRLPVRGPGGRRPVLRRHGEGRRQGPPRAAAL